MVFAGIGTPLVAAALAKRRHAPNLTIILEGGIIGTKLCPGHLPSSTNVDDLHGPASAGGPAGKSADDIRPIRDEIDARVRELLAELVPGH